MVEVLTDIGLVVLGSFLALFTQWVLQRRNLGKQKQQAFRRLDGMMSRVSESVAHGDAFKNKDDWKKELDDLARAERPWLGELYGAVQEVSWAIRDHSFDHANEDAAQYCCDELLIDLCLLQLEMLPSIQLPRRKYRVKEMELGREIIQNKVGATTSPIGDDRVREFLQQLAAGNVEFNPNNVVPRYTANLNPS